MRDTPPEIIEKMHQMMQKKSPIERLKMGASMYDTSKYLVTCSILEKNPQISKAALRQEIFLRFYGNDFTKETQDKILAHLAKCCEKEIFKA